MLARFPLSDYRHCSTPGIRYSLSTGICANLPAARIPHPPVREYRGRGRAASVIQLSQSSPARPSAAAARRAIARHDDDRVIPHRNQAQRLHVELSSSRRRTLTGHATIWSCLTRGVPDHGGERLVTGAARFPWNDPPCQGSTRGAGTGHVPPPSTFHYMLRCRTQVPAPCPHRRRSRSAPTRPSSLGLPGEGVCSSGPSVPTSSHTTACVRVVKETKKASITPPWWMVACESERPERLGHEQLACHARSGHGAEGESESLSVPGLQCHGRPGDLHLAPLVRQQCL